MKQNTLKTKYSQENYDENNDENYVVQNLHLF